MAFKIGWNKYRAEFVNPLTGEIESIYFKARSQYHAVSIVDKKYICPTIKGIFLIIKYRNGIREIKQIF